MLPDRAYQERAKFVSFQRTCGVTSLTIGDPSHKMQGFCRGGGGFFWVGGAPWWDNHMKAACILGQGPELSDALAAVTSFTFFAPFDPLIADWHACLSYILYLQGVLWSRHHFCTLEKSTCTPSIPALPQTSHLPLLLSVTKSFYTVVFSILSIFTYFYLKYPFNALKFILHFL